jgi:hypothetical protein
MACDLDEQLVALGDKRSARRIWHTDSKITYSTTINGVRFRSGTGSPGVTLLAAPTAGFRIPSPQFARLSVVTQLAQFLFDRFPLLE